MITNIIKHLAWYLSGARRRGLLATGGGRSVSMMYVVEITDCCSSESVLLKYVREALKQTGKGRREVESFDQWIDTRCCVFCELFSFRRWDSWTLVCSNLWSNGLHMLKSCESIRSIWLWMIAVEDRSDNFWMFHWCRCEMAVKALKCSHRYRSKTFAVFADLKWINYLCVVVVVLSLADVWR